MVAIIQLTFMFSLLFAQAARADRIHVQDLILVAGTAQQPPGQIEARSDIRAAD
jgi:hypothetical protein